ncbi:sulfurtransferase [bacterium]|jgi:predicted sulfurtransferase|nr:sulfurtransferase [bacterium]NBX72045.1 sulfurtransferase [bacterium]
MLSMLSNTLQILNVSGYHFCYLSDLPTLKDTLLQKGLQLSLKGTVLITPEGLNVFLSGTNDNVHEFINFLCATTHTHAESYDFKFSWTEKTTFNRFLIRVKKEVIAFDKMYNFEHKAPYISAQELEDKLDNNEDIVLIDTRNDYEVALGAFKNAIDPNIKSFKEFKNALNKLEHLKDKTIVTYCTGGVRCEKAAVFLKEEGFKDVFQLKGGILRYFEETPASHYDGECFVFDQRVSVTTKLSTSDKKLCFACRMPLTAKDLAANTYVEGQSCPYCFKGVLNAS